MFTPPAPPVANAELDPAQSVNEILRRWPAAIAPLNAFGIDTCCGGGASLAVAAAHAGVPLAAVLAAVATSTGGDL